MSYLGSNVLKPHRSSFPDISRRQSLTAALKYSSWLSQWSLSLPCRYCVIGVSGGNGHHALLFLVFWSIMFFCNGVHCCKEMFIRWGMTTIFICWCKGIYLDCSSGFCRLSNVVIVGSSPISLVVFCSRNSLHLVEKALNTMKEQWVTVKMCMSLLTPSVTVPCWRLMWFIGLIPEYDYWLLPFFGSWHEVAMLWVSFSLQLNSIPEYLCTSFSLFIHQVKDIYFFFLVLPTANKEVMIMFEQVFVE